MENSKIAIPGVCERDIDLLLLEEFLASAEFGNWFVRKVSNGEASSAVLMGARRSVTESNGESDLEVTLKLPDDSTLRLLIENKVGAGLQPQQAERYRSRGFTYVNRGDCKICVNVLIAPRRYFGPKNLPKGFDAIVSYEEIREWFIEQDNLGERLRYKLALLDAAIEKGTLGYQSIEDDAVTLFWRRYWEYINIHVPYYLLPKPGPKPAAATFITFRPENFPSGVSLIHKLSTGRADLQFSNYGERLTELQNRFGKKLESDMRIARATKSGAITIEVPIVNVGHGFEEQLANIKVGIEAIKRLYEWFHQHRDLL